ncbi:MAG: hypothetical protein AAFV95_00130 [Bacteroidota bacterium]
MNVNTAVKWLDISIVHDFFEANDNSGIGLGGDKPINAVQTLTIKQLAPQLYTIFEWLPDQKLATMDANTPTSFHCYFDIRTSDVHFSVYTKGALPPGQIWLLDNEMAKDGSIDVNQAVALPLQTSSFGYQLDEKQWGHLQSVQIDPPQGQQETVRPQRSGETASFQLAPDAIGQYTFHFVFDDESMNFAKTYFVSDAYYSDPPLAVFHWQETVLYGQAPVKYNIHFSARSTYWRYFFMGIDADQWEKTSIEAVEIEGRSISFQKKAEAQVGVTGQTYYEACSEEVIPLRLRAPWAIKAKLDDKYGKMTLPNAKGQMVNAVQNDDKTTYYSDMYVYI